MQQEITFMTAKKQKKLKKTHNIHDAPFDNLHLSSHTFIYSFRREISCINYYFFNHFTSVFIYLLFVVVVVVIVSYVCKTKV